MFSNSVLFPQVIWEAQACLDQNNGERWASGQVNAYEGH